MDFYKLLDTGEGEKLEQWGKYTLIRPDPQIIWKKTQPAIWDRADAIFKNAWQTKMPSAWILDLGSLVVEARLTPFKHTGVFPEQYDQWQWIKTILNAQCSMLNLFGYTGISSLMAAQAGARVTHVDASSQAIGWARKNQELSGLKDKPIRWILDDVLEFTAREVRRGHKYDLILMDPPVFGHGPNGQTWQFNKSLPKLLQNVKQLLSDHAKGVLINTYAVTTSSYTLRNILQDLVGERGGIITHGETLLKQEESERVLSTGIWGKWEAS